MAKKADYVRSKLSDAPGNHTCHWPGCEVKVPPAAWGCKKHWYKLPYHLRRLVWASFRPGQEIDKRPSEDYLRVAKKVQEWIAEHG